MNTEPEIKVTKIKNRYHARLLVNEVVYDEMACELKCDIGWICREMLRWHDKLGSGSKFTDAARKNQTSSAIGRVWYMNSLEKSNKED